ncbi:MAG: hypothetical protein ACJA2X_000059 [Halocynthiibacter sp.]|jgi:hypothetical protein
MDRRAKPSERSQELIGRDLNGFDALIDILGKPRGAVACGQNHSGPKTNDRGRKHDPINGDSTFLIGAEARLAQYLYKSSHFGLLIDG